MAVVLSVVCSYSSTTYDDSHAASRPNRKVAHRVFVSNIPGETRTLPNAIYTFTQMPGSEAAALRLTTIAVVLSLLALIAAEVLARRLNRRLQGL